MPSVRIDPVNGSVNEGETAKFKLYVDSPVNYNVYARVSTTTTGGASYDDGDYSTFMVNRIYEIPPGEDVLVEVETLIAGSVSEGNEKVSVLVDDVGSDIFPNPVTIAGGGRASIDIIDKPIYVSIDDDTVSEGGNLRFDIKLSDRSDVTAYGEVRVSRGSAENGDLDTGLYEYTIGYGDTTDTIVVDTYEDSDYSDETVTAKIVSVNGDFSIGDDSARGTIYDDDEEPAAPPKVFIEDVGSVREGEDANFNVRVTGEVTSNFTVTVATYVGTSGGSGVDYFGYGNDIRPDKTLTFNPSGSKVQTVTVPVLTDNINDNGEIFELRIEQISGNAAIGDSIGQAIIQNVTAVSLDTVENNTSTQSDLVVNQTKSGLIDASDIDGTTFDTDYYRLDLTAGKEYEFNGQATGSLDQVAIQLRDGNGNKISNNQYAEGANPTISYTPTSDGTYYLAISAGSVGDDEAWKDKVGDYTISFEPIGEVVREITNADLTAYRPQYPDRDIYFEINKTVSDADEADRALGPGIRINSTNANEASFGEGENDLIRVDVDSISQGATLSRSTADLNVYFDQNGNNQLAFTNNEASLSASDSVTTLWVEYTGETGVYPELSITTNGQDVDDKLVFHPFDHMVVLISGENQEPREVNDNTPNIQAQTDDAIGLEGLAVDLLDRGYDVHFVEEPDSPIAWWDLADIGTAGSDDHDTVDEHYTPVINEIEDAVVSRSVTDLALVGYSHGGGTAYLISEEVADLTNGDLSLAYTAYIDAVLNPREVIKDEPTAGTEPEDRRPENTEYHYNAFQPNLNGLVGIAALGGDYMADADNFAQSYRREDHQSIDNNTPILNAILHGVLNEMPLDFAEPSTFVSNPIGTGNLQIRHADGGEVEWADINGIRSSSGDFLIGHQGGQTLLRVVADSVQLSDGSISFSGTTVYGHTGETSAYLFRGDFTLDLETLISTALTDSLAGTGDAGDYALVDLLEFDFNSMNIDADKVEFGAAYGLEVANWRTPDQAVRIDLTQSSINFGFLELSESWYDNNPLALSVGTANVEFSDVSLSYNTAANSLEFEGNAELETVFLNANRIFSADFASGDHVVSYHPVNGWDLIGDVSYQKEPLPNAANQQTHALSHWGVDELTFSIDTVKDSFAGYGTGRLPGLGGTTVALGASGNWDPLMLDSLNFNLSGLNTPLWATGLFVQGGTLELNNLSSLDNIAAVYEAKVDLTYGPQNKAILYGYLDGRYSSSNINGNFDLVSTVEGLIDETTINALQNNQGVSNKLINALDDWFDVDIDDILNYEFLSFDANLNWDKTQKASSFNTDVSILSGVLTGDVDFKIDTDYNFNFYSELALNMPDVATLGLFAGKQLASVDVYVEFTSDGNFANDYIEVTTEYDLFLRKPKFGFKLGFDGEFEFINSLKEIPEIASWDLDSSMEWAMMTANWQNAATNAELVVILPDGTRITEAEIVARDDMQIVDALSSSFSRSVVVERPETGRWDIEAISSDDLGEITYEAAEGDVLPELNITDINHNQQTQMAQIRFEATSPVEGATVTLFADTDQAGANGVEITSQAINVADGVQTFDWDYSDFDGGEFYVYAVLEVPGKPVTIDYSDDYIITYENYVASVALGTGAFDPNIPGGSIGSVVEEGDIESQLIFTVNLNEAAPKGGQVVTLAFSDDSAQFGVDTANQVSLDVGDGFVASGASFSAVDGVSTAEVLVPEGETSFLVGLNVADDAIEEAVEQIQFSAYTSNNALFGESVNTVAAFILDNGDTVVPAGQPSPNELGDVPSFTAIVDGVSTTVTPDIYTGVVDYLEFQMLGTNAGDIVIGSDGNDFMNLLGGDDAASGVAGRDVLDGGVGSNFLTGGAGDDTFFLDGRSGAITWSTITDFTAGDNVNIWGWVDGTSQLLLTQDDAGAEGFTGLTYHYDLDNNDEIDTSITFTGLTQATAPTSSAQAVNDIGYLLFA